MTNLNIEAEREALQTAIHRIEDMLKGDDGQAWKEAEKALPKLKEVLASRATAPAPEAAAGVDISDFIKRHGVSLGDFDARNGYHAIDTFKKSLLTALAAQPKAAPVAEACLHDDTHREGAIWEVCDQCGKRWADDVNPRVPNAKPVAEALEPVEGQKGYRPPNCNRVGGCECCTRECAANKELAEMGALFIAPASPVMAEADFYRGVIAALGALATHAKHGDTLHDEIVSAVGKQALYSAAEPDDVAWAGLDPEFYAAQQVAK